MKTVFDNILEIMESKKDKLSMEKIRNCKLDC